MAAGFPVLAGRGLGLGLDLRWGDPAGLQTGPDGVDRIAPALRAFLQAHAASAAHIFFSWQPRDRARLHADHYAPAWDDLMAALPADQPRALHHTALNLASLRGPPSAALLDFTNQLCRRSDLRWINEDVGFWSLDGRPLPYPLPPILDATGLAACVRNVRACQQALEVPLVLEFPGFSAGVSLVMGNDDAYDFFRRLAEETGAPVTLDVGHLLSWRWLRGFRGPALFDDLPRLPLAQAFEIHLSGCTIDGERFIDAHHGALLDAQLTLLHRLLPMCPRLRAVTFEDPRLTASGALDDASAHSLARLRAAVADWQRSPAEWPVSSDPAPAKIAKESTFGGGDDDGGTEAALADLLFHGRSDGALPHADPTVAARLAALAPAEVDDAATAARLMIRQRRQRGIGGLADAFPRCVAGWRQRHPDDRTLDRLISAFLRSPQAAHWREQPGAKPGPTLEECFAAFANAHQLVDPASGEDEFLSALLRTLTVCPDPAFTLPPAVRRAPAGWFAISHATPPILHAALDGRYVSGPITATLAAVLDGSIPAPTTPEVAAQLIAMGLLG